MHLVDFFALLVVELKHLCHVGGAYFFGLHGLEISIQGFKLTGSRYLPVVRLSFHAFNLLISNGCRTSAINLHRMFVRRWGQTDDLNLVQASPSSISWISRTTCAL